MAEGTGVDPDPATNRARQFSRLDEEPSSLPSLVGPAGLEPASPRPQNECAITCATARWSGRQDLNLRLPPPEDGALPKLSYDQMSRDGRFRTDDLQLPELARYLLRYVPLASQPGRDSRTSPRCGGVHCSLLVLRPREDSNLRLPHP